jgi:hypothetical protein
MFVPLPILSNNGSPWLSIIQYVPKRSPLSQVVVPLIVQRRRARVTTPGGLLYVRQLRPVFERRTNEGRAPNARNTRDPRRVRRRIWVPRVRSRVGPGLSRGRWRHGSDTGCSFADQRTAAVWHLSDAWIFDFQGQPIAESIERPVRIRIGVPPGSLGQRYSQITDWLDENCGRSATTTRRCHQVIPSS